jgi:ferrous iron transport protein A
MKQALPKNVEPPLPESAKPELKNTAHSGARATSLTLDQVPLGEALQIVSVGGPRSFRRRLLELGLLPGCTVKVLRVAPLGDPLELLVRDTHLSIRRNEAQQIFVSTLTQLARGNA